MEWNRHLPSPSWVSWCCLASLSPKKDRCLIEAANRELRFTGRNAPWVTDTLQSESGSKPADSLRIPCGGTQKSREIGAELRKSGQHPVGAPLEPIPISRLAACSRKSPILAPHVVPWFAAKINFALPATATPWIKGVVARWLLFAKDKA